MIQPPDPTKRPTVRQWLWLHPLVPVAAAFACGLLAGRQMALPLGTWFVTLLLVVAIYVLLEIIRHRWASYAAQICVVAAIFCFGAAFFNFSSRQVEANNIARWLEQDPVLIECRGRIASIPRELENTRDGIPLPPQQFCTLAVESVRTAQGWQPACGDATLRVPANVRVNLGDQIELCGFGRLPAGPLYPGGFDYRTYLASSGIHATLWARNPVQIQVIKSASESHYSWHFSDSLERYRQFARAKIQSHIDPVDGLAGDSLQALVLGYRTPAMRPVTQAFADAGVAHLLAISGSHIVLVAGIVWFLLHPLARRPRVRVVLMLAIVWCYVAATPAGAPILRAGITLSFFALATLVSRPMQTLNILAGALIVCLLIDPMSITDAGMQLSFAAAFGLLALSPRLHSALIMPWAEYHAAIARAIGTRRAMWWFKLRHGLLLALLANFIGSMISAPLVAYHFSQLNPLATFSGVLALPVVSLSLIVGLFHLLFSALGSSWLAMPAVWCSEFMNKIVVWLAQIPASSVVVRPPPIWLIAILCVVVFVVILRKHLRLSRAWAFLILLACLVGAGTWFVLTESSSFTIWALGRTAVIQNGRRVVVVNPNSSIFVRNQLDPFLRRQGIARVDALILTRPDATESAGGVDIAKRFKTSVALMSQQTFLSRHYHWMQDSLIKRLENVGCKVIPLAAGDELDIGLMHIETLWPPRRSTPIFSPAQSPFMLRISAYDGSLELIPDAFPDFWPMSPESERSTNASAILLTAGDKQPVPEIPTLCRDDRYGVYQLSGGQLIDKTK